MKHFRYLLLMLMVPGCQSTSEHHPCHGSFYFDNSNGLMNQSMHDQILAGAAKWNAFIGEQYFHIDHTGICPIYVDSQLPSKHELGDYSWNDGRAKIKISPVLNSYEPNYVSNIVAHELGHSENLQHISFPGIMSIDKFTAEFTEADGIECLHVGFCH